MPGALRGAMFEVAGVDAERIARLIVWMSAGALLIWAATVALLLLAPRAARWHDPRLARRLIVGGGVVFPVVVLTALLVYGLAAIPPMLAPGPGGDVSIEVVGHQWWWRVRYQVPGGAPFETANEIRLPVGRRINVRLASPDVIHSFWVPSIAGKMDLIPGRINQIALEPTRTGTFRGACAEFCGTSHARMHFLVTVMEADDFAGWLGREAQPALPPSTPLAERGRAEFAARGCITCHTVRGTVAAGAAGPDLTHVASRQTIAAGQLDTNAGNLRRWIAETERLKPGARMPAFASLPGETLDALAAYLMELR